MHEVNHMCLKKKKAVYDHHQSKEPRETRVIMFSRKLSILQYIWPTIRTLPCPSYVYKYVDVKKTKQKTCFICRMIMTPGPKSQAGVLYWVGHWIKLPIAWFPGMIGLVQVRLGTEVLRTPSSTRQGFKLTTSRSWQYTSCHRDAFSNH